MISDVGICRFSRSFMLLVWIPTMTPAVRVIKGPTFQPHVLVASINGLCLFAFVCMAQWLRKLSCVKVNSMVWMVRSGVGINGLHWLYAVPYMYTTSGLNCARHSHRGRLHELSLLGIHDGLVLSW